MKTYEIEIIGVGDCIQNKLSRELNKEKAKVPKLEKEDWEENNWKKKLYIRNINGKDEVIFPELNVYSFLKTACTKYRIPPPKQIGRTWTTYFSSCVIVHEPAILEYAKIIPFGVMVNGNPSARGKSSKVYTVRPLIQGWKTKIKFVDTEGYLNKEIVKEILSCGGKFVGLSDWRPLYGRFEVKSIKEKKEGEF